MAAVDRADLIVLAFPLYIDSLPFLLMKSLMKFLEVMAEHFEAYVSARSKQLCAIANNGFPEAHHNALAIAICQRFAIDAGIT